MRVMPDSSHRPPRRQSTFVARRAREIAAVLEPCRNACCWRRALPAPHLAALRGALDTSCGGTPAAASPCREEAIAEMVGAVVPSLPRPVARWLVADIARVARAFAALRPGVSVGASLEIVTHDKCRRFHADARTLRAVCTYAGPGTEWVEDGVVDRLALERRDPTIPIPVQNAAIVRDEAAIRRARAGDVVLLKGDDAAGNEGRGAVHRSPPIEERGLLRLVLTLDFG